LRTDSRQENIGLLFWILLLLAVACARFFFLACRDGDGELAVAAALAFAMMCALAAARLFGWLRQYTTEGDTNVPQGANPGQIFL
jgi:hypothetical protein